MSLTQTLSDIISSLSPSINLWTTQFEELDNKTIPYYILVFGRHTNEEDIYNAINLLFGYLKNTHLKISNTRFTVYLKNFTGESS